MHKSHLRSFALLACLSLGAAALPQSGPAERQTESVVPGFLMATPPKIDGVLNEAEWEGVPHYDGLVDASSGGSVPYTVRFWLAYDSKYVYFAAQMPDSDPKGIKANEYRTNVSLSGDDDVAIIIDPFGTLNNFNVFQINPRGATNARIAGGRAAKREWVGEIEAKSRITAEGWETEVRIPWHIMKLPGAGPHDVRFNVYRYSPRYGRDTSWRAIDTNIQATPHWNVVLPEPPPRVLQLLPYNYSGVAPDGKVANMGLDLKTSLNESLDFVGSINPDFRNIENQVLSLDHSYFARLAGESRPFFLEGGQFFSTSNDAPIFTSQRIDAFDVGNKIYGKLGPRTDLAVLNTTDIRHQNDLVFNAKHQISPQTAFRVAYSGLKEPGLRNDAYHWEYRNSNGPWSFFYQNAATTDSATGKGVRHNPGVSFSNGNYDGYLEYSSITNRFDPKLGFAPQRGFHGLDGSMSTSHNLIKGPIQQESYGTYFRTWDKFDGEGKFIHDVSVWTEHGLRSGTHLSFNHGWTDFNGFKDHLTSVAVTRPWNENYRKWSANYTFGEVQGEDYRATGLNFLYRPTQMLQLTGTYQVVQHGDTERQAILSANYDLGSDRSISGRAVMQGDDWNAYIAYKRSGNAGMEYFVILGDPNAQKFRSSLILKVTYPLQMFLGK
jgi:hypothetical protein